MMITLDVSNAILRHQKPNEPKVDYSKKYIMNR